MKHVLFTLIGWLSLFGVVHGATYVVDVEFKRPFYIGVTEVTNGQFRKFRTEHRSGIIGPHTLALANQPVVGVNCSVGFAATGNIVYQMMAQELLHYAVRTMWDDRDGGFFDRSVPDEQDRVGLMDQRLKPFVSNCEAVRVLRRLAESTGNREFDARADATLASVAPQASRQGALAAHYLLARRPLQTK